MRLNNFTYIPTKLLLPCLGALALLVGCDGGSNGALNGPQGGISYATVDDLPNCSGTREGEVALVESDSTANLCTGGIWHNIGASVATEDALQNCSPNREGKKIYVVESARSLFCTDGRWVEYGPGISSNNGVASSSSYAIASSSSAMQSSSSRATIFYGSLTDSRDGQTYKTLTIGEGASAQTWMAQNLNYAPENVSDLGVYAWSGCYGEDGYDNVGMEYLSDSQVAGNCTKYGRLYTWEVAVNNANCAYGKTCSLSGNVQGVCPIGWHLPSRSEWMNLFTYVNGYEVSFDIHFAEGYGSRDNEGDFDWFGGAAEFWSSTEYDETHAYTGFFYYTIPFVEELEGRKYYAIPIRCVQNSNVSGSSSNVSGSSSSEYETIVKPAGYYENNCPAGHACTDAAPSTYLNSEITYGEILDTRDDQVYKVVTIGSQTWMAQNLNYAYNKGTAKSYCYYDNNTYCDKYGRLYLWSAAIDSAAVFSTGGKGCGYYASLGRKTLVRGVCPEGWHLPSTDEWETLFENVGDWSSAGTALKAATGWNSSTGYEADRDAYGFSALPAGLRLHGGDFSYEGDGAYFWLSTESDGYSAYYVELYYNAEWSGMSDPEYFNDETKNLAYKFNAYSVRCIKD